MARRFLNNAFGAKTVQLDQLAARDINGFILRDSSTFSPKRVQLTTSALRSFLGFLYLRGRLTTPLGISACPNTVRRLLEELGYALHVNRKSLSGPQSPERDRQFRYLLGQRQDFTRNALPIISMDTKKKELVGPFKNAGQVWSREALPVNDHDFRSQAKGMAIPRGLYDLQANRGSVLVGTSHDTPQFAVEAIVEWWRGQGRRRYGQASELLILPSENAFRVQCEVWARLLTALLAFVWYQHANAACLKLHQCEISFAKVAKQLQQQGQSLVRALFEDRAWIESEFRRLWKRILKLARKERQPSRPTTWENLCTHWLEVLPT